MGRLALGIDEGIASVGYGIIDLDMLEFVDYGVRLFEESTAADNKTRRTTRGHRRLISRKVTRLDDMKHLLKSLGILTDGFHPLNNVYEIRAKGLKEKLSNDELVAAILHITKRRGSTIETADDTEEASKETGELKEILQANSKKLAGGKFVCEVQLELLNNGKSIRGHHNNFKTKEYVKELKEILSHQELPEEACEAIIQIVSRRRAYYEGPGGRKSPTPYGRYIEANQGEPIDLIEKMRGKCSVYPDEPRAPKLAVTSDIFNLLNDLNNLAYDGDNKITMDQKDKVFKIVDKKAKVEPKDIAKIFGTDLSNISGFRIDKKKKPLKVEFKGYAKLKKCFKDCGETISLKDYEVLDQIIEILTNRKGIEERKQLLNLVKSSLITDKSVELLANLNGISAYHSVSLKAMRELNKEMYVTNYNQMQLLQQIHKGNDVSALKGKKYIEADDTAILSPVAKKSQRETFKVINELRREYGEFDAIVVEMAREKNSLDKKKRITERQKFFEEKNKEVDKLLKESGYDPGEINGKTKMKIRLYLEQDGKSAYTLEPLILKEVINDPDYTEIEHIIPISISLDDSYSNKVLATAAENKVKGNRTPIDAFNKHLFNDSDNGLHGDLQLYISSVKSSKKYSKKKKRYLLFKDDITKMDVIQKFIARNLVDTRYANRVVLNTLTDYFKANDIPTKVFTINGNITNIFRKKIHMTKDRDADFLHHAVDALIAASVKTLGLLNGYLGKYDLYDLYDEVTGEVKKVPDEDEFFDEKYITFISALKNIYDESSKFYRGIMTRNQLAYAPIKISHKVDTKPNRQVANDTIYSTRIVDGEEKRVMKFKDIYDPKFKELTEDVINNAAENKYIMAKKDPATFEEISRIILDHYETFKDDPKQYVMGKDGVKLKGENPLTAYKEEFGKIRKFSKKGNGSEVTSIKCYYETLGNCIDISKNYNLTQGKRVVLVQVSPYRTDFYRDVDEKIKIVTIRYKDVFFKENLGLYCIDHDWYKSEKSKKNISDKAVFLCSLHHNELIGIVKKEGQKYIYDDSRESDGNTKCHDGITPEILKFTATANDLENKIEVKPVYKKAKSRKSPSVGTFINVKKYATDVLGNLYEIKDNNLKLEFK